MSQSVAIIGAGVSGLACARSLADAGWRVRLFDKGSRPGGRLSTRPAHAGLHYDHGAQHVEARQPAFAALLSEMGRRGVLEPWRTEAGTLWVGVPGMDAIARDLGSGLSIAFGCEIAEVRRRRTNGWTITTPAGEVEADHLVVTTPPAQAAGLLRSVDEVMARRVGVVAMRPQLALMATFENAGPPPFSARSDDGEDLCWIAHEGVKPGRGGASSWVALASETWSRAHLEAGRDEIKQTMLPLLRRRIGAENARLVHGAGHRWRYATVDEPLGLPFLASADRRLHVGGDWCLGRRLEDGWTSGRAMARSIIEAREAGPAG